MLQLKPYSSKRGWHAGPGGVRPSHLTQQGHEVIKPALHDNLAEAVRTAQAESDRQHPDVIVASSRGGAVEMNLAS